MYTANVNTFQKIIGCIREALSHDQTDVVRDKLQGILAKLLEEQKRAQNQWYFQQFSMLYSEYHNVNCL